MGQRKPKKELVSYEEASRWAQNENITTQTHWHACSKQGLPQNIPSNPAKVYREDFKSGGWGRFLGTGRIANQNRQFASYEEASQWARNEGISGQAQWYARRKQGLPPNIPSNPERVYQEEFKDGGLGRFLGTGRLANFDRQFLSYKEASAWAQNEGLTTRKQWQDRCKQGLPPNIPSTPAHVYSEEFKIGGLGRFLGTGRVANFNRQFASYEEASLWAQSEGITNRDQWRDRCRQGLPPNIPSVPWQAYPEEFKGGGLGRFLGTGRIANHNRQFTSYEEASRWARDDGVTSHHQWVERSKKGLPPNIPSAPNQIYDDFHILGGFNAFLGLKKVSGASKIERCLRHVLEHAFEEPSSSLVQPRAVGASSKIWRVDVLLPSSLLIVEYDGAFYHWGKDNLDSHKTTDLLEAGYRVVRIRSSDKKRLLPLLREGWDVAVQENAPTKIKITVVLDHLIDLIKRNLLPLSANACHRLTFWRDVELDKINFREVLANYDGFLSYEDASRWAQTEGIASRSQWQARRKQELPQNIPCNPDRVYSEDFKAGGWRRFLQTGPYAPQDTPPVPTEDPDVISAPSLPVSDWRARRQKAVVDTPSALISKSASKPKAN